MSSTNDVFLLDVMSDGLVQEAIRKGFGRGLLQAGTDDERVVALCADLTGSTILNLVEVLIISHGVI